MAANGAHKCNASKILQSIRLVATADADCTKFEAFDQWAHVEVPDKFEHMLQDISVVVRRSAEHELAVALLR